ncbi:MAG: cyclic nucleotide-binding domain-containing protein, partial [Thermodesulfovibrionia bacterium]|nr:cyclic nucleotide-binding domain-containing protein [Thermodesulfovibrionia bacterium]
MVKPGVLKKQVLFEDIGKTELEKIAKVVKKLSFKKGAFLFKEKEDTKGLYLIHSGKVEVSKVTTDGWKQTLAVLRSRHFLGELSIIEKRRHEASAVALDNSEIFLISKDDFEKMEQKDTVITSKIMKKIVLIMSKNLRRMNEKFL